MKVCSSDHVSYQEHIQESIFQPSTVNLGTALYFCLLRMPTSKPNGFLKKPSRVSISPCLSSNS